MIKLSFYRGNKYLGGEICYLVDKVVLLVGTCAEGAFFVIFK